MINYKDLLRLPSQTEKYNDFITSSNKKTDPYSDDADENSSETVPPDQQYHISAIVAAYYNKDSDQLYKYINHLNNYLIKAQPSFFPLLIKSEIIPILIDLAFPGNNFEYRNTVFACLYNITALYSETTPILLSNGILNIFYDRFDTEFNTKSKLSIDGIVNLLIDEPQLIDQVIDDLPVSRIIRFPPFNDIISLFLEEDKNILYSINRLFVIYLQHKIPQTDIDLMISFYCSCLKRKELILKFSALNGLNNLLMVVKIQEKHYSLLTKIDFIEMTYEFNDIYESSDNEKEKKECLKLISFCFEIQSKLFEYSFKSIDYDIRQILFYCVYKKDGLCHFDDTAGISAFELVDTILMNCEQDTYYLFLLCDEINFLEVLYDAIIKGPYFIVYPASESLIKIIQGCDLENDRFVNEKIFEALLKIMFIDNDKIQKKTIEAISFIFYRCINSPNPTIEDCITAFDVNDGVNIFANCMNTTENSEIAQACNNFLLKFFPLQ